MKKFEQTRIGSLPSVPVVIQKFVVKPDRKYVETTIIKNGISKRYENGLEKIIVK